LEHHQGQGRKVNYAEALRCYSKAAEMGHPLAAATLGLLLAHGPSGVKKDEESARRLCAKALPQVKEAALKGDAIAQRLLGVLHSDGLNVEKDDKEAVKWYRLAADQGDRFAQVDLGDV
jgi:TPR repeat protein